MDGIVICISHSGSEVCKLVVYKNLLAVAVGKPHFVVSHILSCGEIKISSSTNGMFPSLLFLR